MASFTSPSAQPKARTGKPNRPKRSADGPNNGLTAQPRDYPITDDFATKKDDFPTFASRRAATNPKTGFNTVPTHSASTRCTEPPPYDPCRGYGREVGRDEDESSADTATANKTKLVHKEGKNPGFGPMMGSQLAGMKQRFGSTPIGGGIKRIFGGGRPKRFQEFKGTVG